MPFSNHLSIGKVDINHNNVLIPTAVGSIAFDNFILDQDSLYEYEIVYVVPEVAHRADLISYAFYNTTDLDWLILLVNGINDPLEELTPGQRIRIPIL